MNRNIDNIINESINDFLIDEGFMDSLRNGYSAVKKGYGKIKNGYGAVKNVVNFGKDIAAAFNAGRNGQKTFQTKSTYGLNNQINVLHKLGIQLNTVVNGYYQTNQNGQNPFQKFEMGITSLLQFAQRQQPQLSINESWEYIEDFYEICYNNMQSVMQQQNMYQVGRIKKLLNNFYQTKNNIHQSIEQIYGFNPQNRGLENTLNAIYRQFSNNNISNSDKIEANKIMNNRSLIINDKIKKLNQILRKYNNNNI